MKRKRWLTLFLSLLILMGVAAPAAADPTEMTGMHVDGRWLGSFNTKAPQHAFCIDGFKGYPRATYAWRSSTIRAPRTSYLMWRFGNNPGQVDAAALSWIAHAANEIGHQNAPGYKDLPKSALPTNVRNRVDQMQDLATENVGPYRLILTMPNQVRDNTWATGTVKLVGGRGQVISDNFGNRRIRVTLNRGRFGNGAASRTFYLANGVGTFQFRRLNQNVNQITGQASVNYGPVNLRRWTSNVSSAQRVVVRMGGDSFQASNSTRVRTTNVADSARVVLLKHGRTGDGNHEPVGGAVFTLTKSQATPGPGQGVVETTGADGRAVFDGLETHTNYWAHEISPPPGYAVPSPNQPIQVTTGGDDSTVRVLGGDPIINRRAIFDLALRKYIHAVNGQVTGQTGSESNPAPTRVHVGDIVQHRITVYNQGEIAGTAEQVIDYIPEGYDFVEDLNPDWTYDEATRTATRSTGQFVLPPNPNPGIVNGSEPSFSVDIFLRVNSTLYTGGSSDKGRNFAEICEDNNDYGYPDVDSTPDCDKDNDHVGGDNIIDNSNNDEDDHDYDDVTPAPIHASTHATEHAKTGSVIRDTLNSSSSLPAGLHVTFRVYDNEQCSGDPVYTSAPITTTEGEASVRDPDGYLAETPGRYFWIGKISTSDGNTTFFEGECGDPNETTNVYNITTTSTESMQLGGIIEDTARVEGDLPAGSKIRFNLYGPNDRTCESDPVHISRLIPTEPGVNEYMSGKFRPRQVGTYFWVEELLSDENEVLTRGKCGEEKEISRIWNVTTVATATARIGNKIRDTAHVTGDVSSRSKLRFKLYGPGDENCADPVLVTKPQPVKGPGFYRSPTYTTKDTGEHYWVEELIGEKGDVIARGICGLEAETSVVTKSSSKESPLDPVPATPIVETSIPVTG